MATRDGRSLSSLSGRRLLLTVKCRLDINSKKILADFGSAGTIPLNMRAQQELAESLKQIEVTKVELKAPGRDHRQQEALQTKLRWLENKVDRLRRKAQN